MLTALVLEIFFLFKFQNSYKDLKINEYKKTMNVVNQKKL